MAVKGRTRRWLAAASEESVRALAAEVERLSHELAESRTTTLQAERQRQDDSTALREKADGLEGAITALQEEVARSRADMAALREEVDTLRGRVDAGAENQTDELASLAGRIEQDEAAIEVIRTRVAGFAEQWRWDGEDLRKTIAALAERVERRS
jgi:chromosome segregation ATPase